MHSDDFARLRKRLGHAVDRVCPGWLCDKKDDLVQAGMMAVLRIVRRSEEKREFSSSYLRKVAYSALVDEIRRFRSRREVSLETTDEGAALRAETSSRLDPESLLAGRRIGNAIRRCLKQLVSPRELAVTLHLLGYRTDQIAGRMGWNQKRARNLVYRGLENLRECLRGKEVHL